MVRMLADITSANIGVWRLEKPYPPWDESHRRYLVELCTKTVLVIALLSKGQATGRFPEFEPGVRTGKFAGDQLA
jgi:hypothetical protein